MKNALLMVDLQNDFCPGGNLAVPGGDEVIPLANQLQAHFDLIVATQDWHPANHASFASNHPGSLAGEIVVMNGFPQNLWPDHCIQETAGAAFHPQLDTRAIHRIIRKGIHQDIDSYSAFFDNVHWCSTGLSDYLYQEQIKTVYILGLATDYCVKYSCLDAVRLGFQVYVITDACRGAELHLGDSARALEEMRAVGATLITANTI